VEVLIQVSQEDDDVGEGTYGILKTVSLFSFVGFFIEVFIIVVFPCVPYSNISEFKAALTIS
jgi:hypothetical protein